MLACNPLPTSYPALTLLTFWVTFCVTFHLTSTHYVENSIDRIDNSSLFDGIKKSEPFSNRNQVRFFCEVDYISKCTQLHDYVLMVKHPLTN